MLRHATTLVRIRRRCIDVTTSRYNHPSPSGSNDALSITNADDRGSQRQQRRRRQHPSSSTSSPFFPSFLVGDIAELVGRSGDASRLDLRWSSSSTFVGRPRYSPTSKRENGPLVRLVASSSPPNDDDKYTYNKRTKKNNSNINVEHESIIGGALIGNGASHDDAATGGVVTERQRRLVEYTQMLLSDDYDDEYDDDKGRSLISEEHVLRISDCIDKWTTNPIEHRGLGVENATSLILRLISERGGSGGGGGGVTTRALGRGGPNAKLRRRNPHVSWASYRLPSLLRCMNELYSGKEFVNRVLSIVRAFEVEYGGGHRDDDEYGGESTAASTTTEDEEEGEDEEVPYKSIIATLCELRTPQAAAAAELVLDRFESRLLLHKRRHYRDDGDVGRSGGTGRRGRYAHSNPPTTETYNNVMSCWAKSGAGCGAYDDFLPAMTSTTTPSSSSSFSFHPTSSWPYSYHPNPCSNLLRRMLVLYKSDTVGMYRMKPDFLSFNVAISSLSKDQMYRNGEGGIGRACYDHLMSMLELYDGGSDPRCAPDLITFSTVLNVLGRGGRDRIISGGGKGGEDIDGDEGRAREILDIMLYLGGVDDSGQRDRSGGSYRDGYGSNADVDNARQRQRQPDFEFDVRPRNRHFNVVLSLMANRSRVDDATLECAMRYVDIMEMLRREDEDGIAGDRSRRYLPRSHSDSRIIGDGDGQHFMNLPYDHHYDDPADDLAGVASRGDERSMTIPPSLRSMTRSAPDIITYNTLLNIATSAGRPEKAEEILNGMITKSSNGTSEIRPDSISFNTVLLAWSKAKSHRGRLKTEKILDDMHKMAKSGDNNVRPDRTSMTTVINSIISTVKSNRSAPFQAERIIALMENNQDHALRPDVVTYTSLIKCWVESGRSRAADRAEEIINTLHQRYDMGYDECKPDTMVYNVAMNSIANSNAPNASERAEALLNRMLDRYYAGDTDLTPTTQSFSTAILAWARSNDRRGAMKAEQLLQTMHDLEDAGIGNIAPNTICYSTCILGWKNSGQRDAGKCADALLKKMELFDSKGLYDRKPNVVAFTNAMEAWINSRQPESLDRVEAILERMIERSRGGDPDSEPTTTTMNVVLKAIRHSSHTMKHKKAEEILARMKRMQENGIGRAKPNIYTYNAFFSACAMVEGNSEEKISAFTSVLSALIDLEDSDHLRADNYTWPAVWKACENLLDVRRDIVWINRVFDLTVRSGMVNELLFNNMRRFLPAQYFQKKLEKKLNTNVDMGQLTVHQLPPEWICNVKLGKDRKVSPAGGKHQRIKMRSMTS